MQGRVQQGSNSAPPVLHSPLVSLPTQTAIADVSATVGATLDCNGLETVWSIEYGATTGYGSTQAGGTTSENGAKTVALAGLNPETLLHWRFKAVNADGTAYSADQTLTTLIGTANLVQRLMKASQPISQDLGTKAIDYSATPVNANIWQSCLYPTGDFQFFLNENILLDWQTDGVKAEFVTSLKSGKTESYICYIANAGHGILIRNTGFYIRGLKSDGTTAAIATFATVTTASDGVWYRYRITRSGINMVVEKTLPSDSNFQNVIISETKNVSAIGLYVDTFRGTRPQGGLCYLNLTGYKWAFGEGSVNTYMYSYNSSKRFYLATNGQLNNTFQNVYCHNSIFGYSRAALEISVVNYTGNIAYQEAGTPATSFHSALWTRSVFEEFSPAKSFGLGYGIKLDASMEAYDQALTFFDASHAAKLIYKNTMPSKLNSRFFFDHANGNELLVYSADKPLNRPINTAGKKVIVCGGSMASDTYHWPVLLSNYTGLIRTTASYSGNTLSSQVLTSLQAAVASTPNLISDKEFIIMEGGFNDYSQNVSLTDFINGIAILYSYLRTQNPSAPIFICAPYNWGNPIEDGTIMNTSGMSRNSLRQAMSDLVTANTNCYYFDWSLAGIVQADIPDNLHTGSIVGGYKLAKLMYDKILTIY